MSEHSIARQGVLFSEEGVGPQILIKAVTGVLEYFEETEPDLFERWISRRWVNGRQSFRLGLRDKRIGYLLSADILVLPNDGKATGWFKPDDQIFGVEVCTRALVDDLSEDLRDITDEEDSLASIVSLVAVMLAENVKKIMGED